ncbi:major facilitator superfamily domain-containing protein [Limtongia smithiae]|uniref:major facilitator superfamily domain-containing protein n=1 Tax=Limtongia smithiae TaxID=1125753 RepID=UPI0034CF8838
MAASQAQSQLTVTTHKVVSDKHLRMGQVGVLRNRSQAASRACGWKMANSDWHRYRRAAIALVLLPANCSQVASARACPLRANQILPAISPPHRAHYTTPELAPPLRCDAGDAVLDAETGAPPALALEPAASFVLDAVDSKIYDADDEKADVVEKGAATDSTSGTRPARRVPIGFLHRVCFVRELENPYEYPSLVKGLVVFVLAFAAMVPAMGSAVFYPAVHDIADEFDTSLSVINLSVGFYMFSLGLFPLWWSYFSEIGGRRGVYVVSFLLFTLFNIGCALAKSITMLIIFRILTGAAAASSQTVGAGAIGDIFVPTERGRANGYFYLGPLCGPMLAPIFSGALTDKWGWRSTQYLLIITGGSTFLMLLFILPETLRPQVVLPEVQQEREERKQRGVKTYYARETVEFFVGPFYSFRLLKYPSFLFAITYNSFGYGCLYIMNNTFPEIFEDAPYDYSSLITGLLYLPNGFGYLIGSLVGGRWSDRIVKSALKRNNGVLVPEARLAENTLVAGAVVCGGMLMFGWTAWKKLIWIVPIIGSFMFGFGSLIIFTSTLTFLVDSMPKRRSAAVSINTCTYFFYCPSLRKLTLKVIRCMTAAVASFITVPLLNAIGAGVLFSILTATGLFFVALQVYVKKKGPEWRAKMGEDVS